MHYAKMDTWNFQIYRWVTVLMQLAAVIAAAGISLNAVQLVIDVSLTGNSSSWPGIASRVIGILIALAIVLRAPAIVGSLQGILRTPLVP